MASVLNYFAYGSNLHPIRLGERTPSCKPVAVARLREHRLHFHKKSADGSAKCNALYTGNASDAVNGVVYKFNAVDKQKLDAEEGLNRGYKEKIVTLEDFRGPQPVFTYVAEERYIDFSLLPYTWYKEFVLEGARYFQLPQEYIDDWIANVEADKDLDENRNRENYERLNRMRSEPPWNLI